MSRRRIRTVLAALLAGGALTAVLVAATASTAATTPAWLKKVEQVVAKAYKGEGMQVPPGPKAAKNKNIWNLACTLAIPDCANENAGVIAAGKALGWHVTTEDQNTNPVTTAQDINSAIAAQADGIIIVGIDCSSIKNALTAAKAANIPVIVVGGLDCSPPLYTATTLIANLPFEQGQAGPYTLDRIDWAIAQTRGNLKLIVTDITDFTTAHGQTEAMLKDLKVCPTCKVVDTIKLSIQNLPALGQLLPAALNQYPQANAVFLYSGSALETGAQTAIENAGRATGKNRLLVVSAEGDYGEPGLIRKGWDIGFTGFSLNWNGWMAMDFLNRVFHGITKMPQVGVGIQLVDKTHNLPKGNSWSPPLNYEAAYLKSWGVK
jgi:ABC-type sugar transport system substrate-binding protein